MAVGIWLTGASYPPNSILQFSDCPRLGLSSCVILAALLQRFGPHLGLTAARLQNLEAQFHKWGALLVMAARFIVILRQLNGLVAGAMAMPWFRFVAANVIGAILWIALWTLGPYFFTETFMKYR